MRASTDEAGCWIDGHWGQYGIARMIDIAADYGYIDPAIDIQGHDIVAIAHRKLAQGSNVGHITNDEEEQLDWATDEVEQWLNDNVAPEGYSFCWYEGEFFLWSDKIWAEI